MFGGKNSRGEENYKDDDEQDSKDDKSKDDLHL